MLRDSAQHLQSFAISSKLLQLSCFSFGTDASVNTFIKVDTAESLANFFQSPTIGRGEKEIDEGKRYAQGYLVERSANLAI